MRSTTSLPIVEIGLHHEQQHQELMLTDILHAFAQNPTAPAYDPDWRWPRSQAGARRLRRARRRHLPDRPRRRAASASTTKARRIEVLLQPVRIARALVTNGEWLAFMADGGYATPALWLSDGWAAVQTEGWGAPGYWQARSTALVHA